MHIFRSPMNSQLGFGQQHCPWRKGWQEKDIFLFWASAISGFQENSVYLSFQRRIQRYIQVQRKTFLNQFQTFSIPVYFLLFAAFCLFFPSCWCPLCDPPAMRPSVPQTSLSRSGVLPFASTSLEWEHGGISATQTLLTPMEEQPQEFSVCPRITELPGYFECWSQFVTNFC